MKAGALPLRSPALKIFLTKSRSYLNSFSPWRTTMCGNGRRLPAPSVTLSSTKLHGHTPLETLGLCVRLRALLMAVLTTSEWAGTLADY